ncbi:hypothetical protein LXL04_021242 [Taraxacum kok-saghyz]
MNTNPLNIEDDNDFVNENVGMNEMLLELRVNKERLLDFPSSFPESIADPVLQIVGARLLPFTSISVRSESRSKAPKSLLADLTTHTHNHYTLYSTRPQVLKILPHSILMPKKKLTLILANYLTSTNYDVIIFRSNDQPPLHQGAKRRLAIGVDHTT